MIPKRFFMITAALLFAAQIAAAQDASCHDLTSATDKSYCLSIETSSMLPTLTGGVSGATCGYEQTRVSCAYPVAFPSAVETIHLERKDHHWWDHEIQPHCEALGQKYSAHNVRVTRVTFGGHVFGNVCYDRDWKRKCVKWIKKVSVTCTLDREQTNFDANSDTCPLINDLSRPKECAAAHQSDASALDQRRIEIEAVLGAYKRELELYKNLEKVMTKLLDASRNLSRFEYNAEDVQKLKELSDLLVEKSSSDESFQDFEKTVMDVVEIVESIGSNVPITNDTELTGIQNQLNTINKELKGKERIVQLLNLRLGEINTKLIFSQSRS